MNEFTKQDLECLKNAIELQLQNISMSIINTLCRRELLGKINTLIDNYCEHKGEIVEDSAMIKMCLDCERALS